MARAVNITFKISNRNKDLARFIHRFQPATFPEFLKNEEHQKSTEIGKWIVVLTV